MDMPPSHRSLAGSAQTTHAGAGLMRYHSAPSAVLSSFLHNEEFFCESIPHVDNSELARLLPPVVDDLCSSISHPIAPPVDCFRADSRCAIDALLNSKPPFLTEAAFSNGFHVNRTIAHLSPTRCNKSKTTTGRLSSIFEHSRDDPCANFHISASPSMQVDTDNYRKPEFSLPKLAMPISTSSFRQSLLATTKSNLIRHSSFPANFLSGRAMERCRTPDISEPCIQTTVESRPSDNIRDSHMQTMATQENIRVPHGNARATHLSHDNIKGANFPTFNGASNPFKIEDESKVGDTRCLESPLSINRTSLFRQSSSPSGFLSQSSFDGTVSGCEKGLLSPSSGSSSEDDRRGKESQYLSRMSGFWDEAGLGMTAFGQRKRERETEDKIADGLSVPGSIQKCPAEEETLQWSFGGHMDTSSGSLLSMDESVLCRARAKRGCATHPRSIAERVRRTKISEGMRKLQELVPNMEKQTNIATMLDEAVEYVKFLQQQVQKLSENQAKCNGMCHSKGNT